MTNWFQSDECLALYSSMSFIEPFECSVSRGGEVKGRIVGYIQKDGGGVKGFLSRRAIINGGPMLADDITPEELTQLLKTCKSTLNGKAIFVETRNFFDYSAYRQVFLAAGWSYEPHYDIKILCGASQDVEEKIGKHRKKYVRLSLRDGASVVGNPTIGQIEDFYEILSELYRIKVKTGLWPFEFFRKLYESPSGRYFLIEYDGHIVGGSACVAADDGSVYEWFACGKDGVFKNIHPSSLTKYAGITYASENGFTAFDMMGAGAPGDGGYGVRDFKLEFGGELMEYGRFKLVLAPALYGIGAFGIKILKKLK